MVLCRPTCAKAHIVHENTTGTYIGSLGFESIALPGEICGLNLFGQSMIVFTVNPLRFGHHKTRDFHDIRFCSDDDAVMALVPLYRLFGQICGSAILHV
jgi:hypothetical protein